MDGASRCNFRFEIKWSCANRDRTLAQASVSVFLFPLLHEQNFTRKTILTDTYASFESNKSSLLILYEPLYTYIHTFRWIRTIWNDISLAGRPYPLQNCTAGYNQTGSWIRISCVEGYDGGLPQKFVAIVDKQRLESSNPYWELELRKPATVALYAVNVKGSSDPIIMEGEALKGVAKFTGA